MKMCGIIFSEMYSDELNAFTHDRNMAAIPYGGRYRLVDFALSNMVNSGITSVGVLAKQHYHSLMTHLGNTQEWDLNRKNGGLQILPPYASESLNQANRGKLDELRNALDFLREDTSPCVVMADAHVICNMDFRPVVESHINSGCDITVVATQSKMSNSNTYKSVIQVDGNMRVTSYALDHVPQPGDYCGMSIMVMDRQVLIDTVSEFTARGVYFLERDFIQSRFNTGDLSINIYPFTDPVLRVTDIESYFSSNMALLDEGISNALFRPDRPIYTRVNDEVPSHYGMDCNISGCIIADGCILDGNAEHSVIGRGVRIAKGATVKNCIIMQGSVIGEGASLENVIVDKWATITAGSQLKGLETAPVIIRKGVTV